MFSEKRVFREDRLGRERSSTATVRALSRGSQGFLKELSKFSLRGIVKKKSEGGGIISKSALQGFPRRTFHPEWNGAGTMRALSSGSQRALKDLSEVLLLKKKRGGRYPIKVRISKRRVLHMQTRVCMRKVSTLQGVFE